MKIRTLGKHAGPALALVLSAASLSACGEDAEGSSAAPDKLVIWLQPEAEKGWPQLLDRVNADFEAEHGIEVDVQTQQWEDHLTKLDTALAGSQPPAVVELGNTETAKYLEAGVFADLTGAADEFDGSDTWVQAMTDSCTFDGTLGCVPYYGGSRAVIYNKDLFEGAGIDELPTSLDELYAAADALMDEYGSDRNFSAFYMPGQYSKAALSFVYDQGGQIAIQQDDAWRGDLDSPESIAGLTTFKELVDTYSRADRTGDDSKQDAAFAQGKVGMMYGLSWEPSVIVDPEQGGNPALDGRIGAFPMPSSRPGETMPVFLGGSNLAIPATYEHQDLARDWLALYTSTESQTVLAEEGLVPNSTELLDEVSAEARPFAEGAASTWFTPIAGSWARVESEGVLEELTVSLLTGEATVEEAAATASEEITDILNGA
jgi:N,N'-diacetylchitobiose transport system substrate-binding protein